MSPKFRFQLDRNKPLEGQRFEAAGKHMEVTGFKIIDGKPILEFRTIEEDG